jgi:Superinfection immunity protein
MSSCGRLGGFGIGSRRGVAARMWARISVSVFLLFIMATITTACVPAPWDVPRVLGFGWSILTLPFALLGLALYFLPTIIAAARRAKNLVVILLVNIFAGWTGVGWIVALVWSLVDATSK